jgi:uncharacterized protein (TIGR02145 family)
MEGSSNITVPVLSTSAVTNITYNSATCGGTITSDGGASITSHGVCWSSLHTPTTADSLTTDGTGIGSFTSSITGLKFMRTFYLRAYAVNSEGTAYGSQISFTTPNFPPGKLVAAYLFNGDANDGSGNGNNGTVNGATPTADRFMLQNQAYSFNGADNYISIPDDSLLNFGTGDFTISAVIRTGVIPTYSWSGIVTKHNSACNHDTEYFLMIEGGTGHPYFGLSTSGGVFERIYGSTNVCDNAYHVLCGIKENGQIRLYVDGIIVGTAASSINPDNSNPVNIGRSSYNGGQGYFNGIIDDIRLYKSAITEPEIAFITGPIISTMPITNISQISGTSGGTIKNDGGYPITARGVCWSTSPNPTIADNKTVQDPNSGSFTSTLAGLIPNTTYYVRAYLIYCAGTAYGQEQSFTTQAESGNGIIFNPNLTYGSVSDIDGNTYKTIQIGTQIWMAENLRTTKYNDNIRVPSVKNDATWNNLSTPGYCWYQIDSTANKNVYGALYNWYAVNKGNLCPSGWHVPADSDFHKLALAIDSNAVLSDTETNLGGTLKETGTVHWASPNGDATNESGFTALPAGTREDNIPGGYDPSSNFEGLQIGACWWTSTELDSNIAWYRNLGCVNGNLARLAGSNQSKRFGYSVRCVKDGL